MRWINGFAYLDDDGVLHLSAPLLCDSLGVPRTKENVEEATRCCAAALEEGSADTTVLVLSGNEERPLVESLGEHLARIDRKN